MTARAVKITPRSRRRIYHCAASGRRRHVAVSQLETANDAHSRVFRAELWHSDQQSLEFESMEGDHDELRIDPPTNSTRLPAPEHPQRPTPPLKPKKNAYADQKVSPESDGCPRGWPCCCRSCTRRLRRRGGHSAAATPGWAWRGRN